MSEPVLEGGCLCRAVRFSVSGPVENPAYCHCQSCRRASGAPFVAWATFRTENFKILQGALAHYDSSRQVTRGFCSGCGGALTYVHDQRPGEIDVVLVALDEPFRIRPECHIWVSHKLPWVVIADGLPQYPEWRRIGAGTGP